jgi:hypothetical protein
LCSFQTFHQKYNKIPSKLGLCFLSTIQRIRFHHPLTVRGGDICSSCFPSMLSRVPRHSCWMDSLGKDVWVFLAQSYIIGKSGRAAIHVLLGCWQ